MSNTDNILIRKASGETEAFNVEKLIQSLKNAGAESKLTSAIVNDISAWIYDGITTKKIYTHAFGLLKQQQQRLAARYKLKKAIMELGPTGYPFEFFIGQIFQVMGYETKIGQTIQGHCVTHEVDVIADFDKTQVFVECKFFHNPGKTANVKVPLYIRSRVDDIIKKRKADPANKDITYEAYVVTNTRFTDDAIKYGKCSGLKMLAWNYPEGKGLKHIIDKERIFPVTALTKLTKPQKKLLLEQGVVICRQILSNPKHLDVLDLSDKRHQIIMNEIQALCTS